MRLIFVFVTILAMLPTLLKWTMQGKISVMTAGVLAVLLVFLLSLGSRAFRILAPALGLAAFGLQYADEGTWNSFLRPIAMLLPLGMVLFGIYIMFSGFGGKKKRRYED
jgi:hypothetical protein